MKKIKVILVDDHELVRMGFRLLLEGANNLEVIAEFSSGEEVVNEFLNYDYVGAPNKDWVGNGGLSLRKKSKILDILKKSKRNSNQNEDVFFTEKEHNLNIPDITTANKFSNEGIYSDESFGVHKPWWYLNEEEINKKERKCKGLKQLIELNK